MSQKKKCPLTYSPENDPLDCLEHQCAWWTGLMTTEGTRYTGIEYGCAIKKLAEKGPDGNVSA